MIKKTPKSYRLSERTIALIEKLAKIHDTTATRIIEECVRERAKREKVQEENNG